MALVTNAVLRFTDYVVQDGRIVTLHFICTAPGAGEGTDLYCQVTAAEIGSLTLAQLRTLVTNRLTEKYRSAGVSTVLDPLIGGTITI